MVARAQSSRGSRRPASLSPRRRAPAARRAIPWETVLDRLHAFYHAGEDWRTPYLREHAESPFQVLIGTILSQRTRDETTARASERLFAAYPTPEALAAAPVANLIQLIRPVGFYPTKAQGIRDCARQIVERFGGKVPVSLQELLSLPMVGRKTANCTLVFGYGIPAVPVDTHVHRIANRLGAVRTRTPDETEEALMRVVPMGLWIPINPLLVQHGQNVCKPLGPQCARCPISKYCATGEKALAKAGTTRAPRRRPAARPR